MRYGILDIGTNTVHGAIYQVCDQEARNSDSFALASPVLSHLQNNALTSDGILALTSAMKQVLDWFSVQKAEEIHVFATASLRNIENAKTVQDTLETKLGIAVQILSGEEEAECDFLALQSVVNAPSGIGFDLGGGSMQVIQFSDGQLIQAASLPTGTNRYWQQFVKGSEPTTGELETMYEAASAIFRQLPKATTERLYAMGGTAKRACKILAQINGNPTEVLQVEELRMLLEVPELLKQTAGERYRTMTAGIVIISALCAHFETAQIQVLSCGVRDGYIRKLLKMRA